MSHQRVAILGASQKPERYSNKAMKDLLKAGHEVVLINRGLQEIDGHPVLASLADVTGQVDTVTMYVNPEISTLEGDKLVALKPGRVIFSPGTENPALDAKLKAAGIETLEACPLVMLRTGQF
jgi:predicted CoA-binding protein